MNSFSALSSPNSLLSLMELRLKLSMLLALVRIQRKQTLLLLNIKNEYLKKSDEEFVFILSRHVKQSRPNYLIPRVIILRYILDTDICPYVCLEDYIERIKPPDQYYQTSKGNRLPDISSMNKNCTAIGWCGYWYV